MAAMKGFGAVSMSASVGAVVVAKVEHLLQDRTHGRERVEAAFPYQSDRRSTEPRSPRLRNPINFTGASAAVRAPSQISGTVDLRSMTK